VTGTVSSSEYVPPSTHQACTSKEGEETPERYLLMGKDNTGQEAWDDTDDYLNLHAGQGS
jgi:hypothetical protein